MLRSFLTIAFRNFLREKVFTLINITGLALGLCSCICMYLYTSYEFSFDRFHPHYDRIYRVMMDVTEKSGDKSHFARTPIPLPSQIRSSVTGLEAAGSVIPYDAKIAIPQNRKGNIEFDSHTQGSHFSTTVMADPQWFSVFGYSWLAGDPTHQLETTSTTVLTESRARQYFGNILYSEMIGKQVIYGDSLFTTVSGIVKDWPAVTDLGFTDFISSATLRTNSLGTGFKTDSWNQHEMQAWTFVKIKDNASIKQITRQLAGLVNTSNAEVQKPTPWLQPLAEIHFDADVIENVIRTAHRPTLYGIVTITSFILLLAIINFINLSTAQSLRRFKEAGIRKVLGSGRRILIAQHLLETLLLTLLAVIPAVCLAQPVLHAFHDFLPERMEINIVQPSIGLFLILIVAAVTFFSGIYPAIVLSTASPALVLRNTKQQGGSRWFLRKSLIVFQFCISLVFITGVLVVRSQLNFIRNKDLGFSPAAIVMITTPFGDSLSKIGVLENLIQKIPGVNATALQWVAPLVDNGRGRGIKFKPTDTKETSVVQVAGNERFIDLYKIRLLAGRNLEPADSMKEIIINETLLKMMGYTRPADAIGKSIYWSDSPYPIVGVVGDFNSRSLHEAIGPVCIVHRKDREGMVAVKFGNVNTQTLLSDIGKAWKEIYPAKPFSYSFYDESLEKLYTRERQTAMLLKISMTVTIFISCFGLFGLALFTAEKRTKEISIRKILGASVSGLTMMLCSDFLKLVFFALVISIPFSWYTASQWLNNFAFHINISFWIFIMAGVAALLITLCTVGFQAIKVAISNPAKNLRNE